MYHIKEEQYPMRPRERLNIFGPEKLSEQELLAILLRTGSKKENVMELAVRVLTTFSSLEEFRRASLTVESNSRYWAYQSLGNSGDD